MALSEDDKKQVMEMFSDAVALGMAKFRSKAEEEEAKRQQENKDKAPPKPEEKNDNDGGFDPVGWFLGG